MDISGIWDGVKGLLQTMVDAVLKVLPISPFRQFLESLEDLPYLKYLNWIFPIGDFIAIAQAWLVAIGLFYLYMIILRWIKAIE